MKNLEFGDILKVSSEYIIFLGYEYIPCNIYDKCFYEILQEWTFRKLRYFCIYTNITRKSDLSIANIKKNIRLNDIYLREFRDKNLKFSGINIAEDLNVILLKYKLLNNKEIPEYYSNLELQNLNNQFLNQFKEKYKNYLYSKIGDVFKYNGIYYDYYGVYCSIDIFSEIYNEYSDIPRSMYYVSLYNDYTGYVSLEIETFCHMKKVGHKDVVIVDTKSNIRDRDYELIKRDCKGFKYI